MKIDTRWGNVGDNWKLLNFQPETSSTWQGKFSRGEVIPIFHTDSKNVVKLCIVSEGKTTWHDTIELWLYREIKILPPNQTLKCEVYTFSPLVDRFGNPTSLKWGTPIVHINRVSRIVTIGDATFQMLTST